MRNEVSNGESQALATESAASALAPADEQILNGKLANALEPIDEFELSFLVIILISMLDSSRPICDAFERAVSTYQAGPFEIGADERDERVAILLEEMRAQILAGGTLSAVCERYRLILPAAFRYAIWVGEECGDLIAALYWYSGSLYSAKPYELRLLELVDLYLAAGIPVEEMLRRDRMLQENEWARLELERLWRRQRSQAGFAEVFPFWSRGLGIGPCHHGELECLICDAPQPLSTISTS